MVVDGDHIWRCEGFLEAMCPSLLFVIDFHPGGLI